MNFLYEEARKCYVNMNSSKALGVRITPEYVGPLPSNKRERHPRKCKKEETFNYKMNTDTPFRRLREVEDWYNLPNKKPPLKPRHLCAYEDESCPECSKKE